MNRLETNVLNQIAARSDLRGPHKILVACSGGGDSIALLRILKALEKSLEIDLVVGHFDHKLRSKSSDDAQLVEDLCKRLALPFVLGSASAGALDSKEGGLETRLRDMRWSWLRQTSQDHQCSVVATGHTLDDHTETIMMRLARGPGIAALTPLSSRQDLRWSPLIECSRASLRSYLNSLNERWIDDETNALDFTTRNRWRKILEDIRKEAPAFDDHLWMTHEHLSAYKAIVDRQVASWENHRWSVDLKGENLLFDDQPWLADDLLMVLREGFMRLNWAPESTMLYDVQEWLSRAIPEKSRSTWGTFSLEVENSPLSMRLYKSGRIT